MAGYRRAREEELILQGKDEFGILLDEHMRVDILAFKWDTDGRTATRAVETKLANSPARSVGFALGQAASYQILLDQVYIARLGGDIKHRESMLSDLGLGWLSVPESGIVSEHNTPQSNRRFDTTQCMKQVLSRPVLPLTFVRDFRA